MNAHSTISIRLALLPIMALLMGPSGAVARESPPAYGQLRIATDPAGASVTIDGTSRDPTPVVIADLLPGEHLLVIGKTGYRELRRTVTLRPDQREALDLKLEPLCGLVLVTSVPDGADVQVKEASRGKTPLLLTDLPFGEHRLCVSAPGFQSKNLDIDIKDRKPIKVVAELVSDSAAAIIQTEPPGALVTLNGISVGTTPCTVDRVQEGNAELKVVLEGYVPYETTVKLMAGRREEISLILTPLPTELIVNCIPEKARVYVDNQYYGDSPITITNLAAGTYRVRAEMPGHEAVARPVTLTQGQPTREEFRLEINVGKLELITEPADVLVTVDGRIVGKTIPRTTDPNGPSTPLVIPDLEVGSHTVELAKEGFFGQRFSIESQKDQTTSRSCRLQQQPNYEVQTAAGLERGILISVDVQGNVRLEVRGVVKTIPAKDVISKRTIAPE